jgi:cytochrome c oxidase subunit II
MSPSKLLGLPEVFSAHGGRVDHMLDVVQWFMIALGLGWSIFLFIALVRFRASRNPKASYHGVRNHISTHIEIAVVVIEAVLLLGFAFPLWKERTDSWKTVQAQNPVRVRVIGWQFGWTYHYAGKDGKFGRTDSLLKKSNSDTGLDLNDPNAQDDFVSPILKLPVNRPCILMITANDVIHNYSIVPMRIQQDAIPGREIPMWFTPIKTLETGVVCGQLCGEGHGNMVGQMEVVKEKAFTSWFDEQSDAALKANAPKPVAINGN